MADAHKNFAKGTLTNAPGTSGTSFVLSSGEGALFAANMPVTIVPDQTQPDSTNAEIGYVTNVSSDTLTVTRAQESTGAKDAQIGWLVLGTVTAKSLTDIEADLTALETDSHTHSNKTVLDATTASFTTADETKLDGIEALADVTDATNVAAAGAVMESDASTASMSFVVDEDSMASDSATKVPTQQSVKAYVDAEVAGAGGGSGDVVGPASSTSGALSVFDGTTGKLLKEAPIIQTLNGSTPVLAGSLYNGAIQIGQSDQTGRVLLAGGEIRLQGSDPVVVTSSVNADTINEHTAAAGVTIDGVLIKDGLVDGKDVSTLGVGDVTLTGSQTLTNKTLTTPTISSTGFTNAQHAHSGASSGGQIAISNTTGTLAVNRGGTGAATLTGILKGNGTSAVTAVTAPAGAIVGTTDTQTLTNKTISGSSNTVSNIGPSARTGGFYIGTITGATLGSTGNKSVTGVGFTPKLVRFTITPTASSVNVNSGIGAMTSSNQYYSSWSSTSGSSARNSSTSACIAWHATNNSTPSLLASYVSMDSDGFTINVSTANSAFDVAYEAYG